MVKLSFLEEIADNVSLVYPAHYLPLLEECTAPHLVNPTLPHIDVLVYKLQNVPDDTGEILRAIRRRLHNDNGYVRHLTIKVLTHLIRKSTPQFHDALSQQKGILKELEITASSPSQQTANGWGEARKSAKQLILNLNTWFLNHPNPNTHALVNLVTDVKLLSGPNAFSEMTADHQVRLAMPGGRPISSSGGPLSSADPKRNQNEGRVAPPFPSSFGPSSTAGSGAASTSRGRERGRAEERTRVVDAIPVFLPTESTISTMLENCATLAEYLPNAAIDPVTGAFLQDDILDSFRSSIEKEHASLTLLLSSDLNLDREVIRCLVDNQSSLLSQLKVGRKPTQERTDIVKGTLGVPSIAAVPTVPRGETRIEEGTAVASSSSSPSAVISTSTNNGIPVVETGVVKSAPGEKEEEAMPFSSTGNEAEEPVAGNPTAPPDLDDLFGAGDQKEREDAAVEEQLPVPSAEKVEDRVEEAIPPAVEDENTDPTVAPTAPVPLSDLAENKEEE